MNCAHCHAETTDGEWFTCPECDRVVHFECASEGERACCYRTYEIIGERFFPIEPAEPRQQVTGTTRSVQGGLLFLLGVFVYCSVMKPVLTGVFCLGACASRIWKLIEDVAKEE